MFKNLLKAAVGVVTLPVEIIADSVTLGGAMTDKDEPYTASKLRQIKKNLDKALDPDED